MKRKIIEAESRQFEAEVHYEMKGNYITVYIYEVIRPNWIFFRTSFFDFCRKCFWLSDIKSIDEAIDTTLATGLAREKYNNDNLRKIKEYEKSLKTK